MVYTMSKYSGIRTLIKIQEDTIMFCFRKKKKSHAKIFVIIGIVIGAAAAAAGAYFLFTKVLKDKLCKKDCEAIEECCDCEEICEEVTEVVEETIEE